MKRSTIVRVQITELPRQLSWEISSRVSAGCKRTSNNRAEHVPEGQCLAGNTSARVAERRKGSQRSEDTLCRVTIQITTRVILMGTTQDNSELMSKFRIQRFEWQEEHGFKNEVTILVT